MNWRILLAAVVTCTMVVPGTALASHMAQYHGDAIERDLGGQIREPDGVESSVLGFPVRNCLVELPVAGSFTGRCSPAHQATGTGLGAAGPIAPGCTGDNQNPAQLPPVPKRYVDGQCGLWEFGVRPNGIVALQGYFAPVVGPQIGPGKVPQPASVKGLAASFGLPLYPGRYEGPVRFFDARLDMASCQNPQGAGGTCVRDWNRLLKDLQDGGMGVQANGVGPVGPVQNVNLPVPVGATLPALPLGDVAGVRTANIPGAVFPAPYDHFLWAWYGQWDDLNGNGVLDHCYGSCKTNPANGAGTNEFAWLGACATFSGPREPDAITAGVCIEDGNPNLNPPGRPCAETDPGYPFSLCAGTSLHTWFWPGTHHGDGLPPLGGIPGNQIATWAVGPAGVAAPTPGNCSDPPTCDDVENAGNFGPSDPLLGPQDYKGWDASFHDRTGDGVNNLPPDDSARQWSGYLGQVTAFYGDDGLLVTLVVITGVNCRATEDIIGYDLRTAPGTTGACTSTDVDRFPTISPMIQDLVVGADNPANGANCNPSTIDPECPTGGLKGTVRSTWVTVRETTPSVQKLASSVVDSNTVYQATAGPLRGAVGDQATDNGWSREPNLGSATYQDKAGVTHTVTEQYVGVAPTNCEDIAVFPVGDTRNPTAQPDAESSEAAHRGFCNVHVGGAAQPAYRDYALTFVSTPAGPKQIGRGWLDLQPVRGVVTDAPIFITSSCTHCLWFGTDINFGGGGFVGGVAPIPGTVNGNSISVADPEGTTALPSVRDPTDHRRTMGPGRYYFISPVGLWTDKTYRQDESLFPQSYGTVSSTYPTPADSFPQGDGWVGVVARISGQWHYRGFGFATCPDYATDKDRGNASGLKGSHDAAECNPYKDGNVNDPQDYTTVNAGGEFLGACDSANMGPVFFAAQDGELDTQIIAIPNYGDGIGPPPQTWQPPPFPYGPGKVDPLAIPVTCNGNFLIGTTWLYWVAGGQTDSIVTWVEADITRGADMPGSDHVVDVDYYPALALPVEVAPPAVPI